MPLPPSAQCEAWGPVSPCKGPIFCSSSLMLLYAQLLRCFFIWLLTWWLDQHPLPAGDTAVAPTVFSGRSTQHSLQPGAYMAASSFQVLSGGGPLINASRNFNFPCKGDRSHVMHMTVDSHLPNTAWLQPLLNHVGLHDVTTCSGSQLCVKGTSNFCCVASCPFSLCLLFWFLIVLASRNELNLCRQRHFCFQNHYVFYCWSLMTVVRYVDAGREERSQFILLWRIEFHCI